MLNNPYELSEPSMIGVSSGRTSGFLFKQILDAYKGYLPSHVIPCFQNTGKEREESLEFLEEMSRRWHVPVIWLEYRPALKFKTAVNFEIVNFKTASRKGEPYDMLIDYLARFRREVKMTNPVLPNPVQRICTAYLKVKTTEQFMESIGFKYYQAVMGIRYDEPRRVAKLKASNEHGYRYEYIWPLFDQKITKSMIKEWWLSQDFDLRLDAESDLGNCDLCFDKHISKLVQIAKADPSRLDWWCDKEDQTGQNFGKSKPTFNMIREALKTNDPILAKWQKPPREPHVVDCICGDGD